ncbi:MAG: phage adaptor protein [Flavobacteriaceae bacterium]
MTYAELVQKIRDYTEVSSTVLSDTIVDGFIQDAEFRILREVDSDNNRRYATTEMVVGQRFIDMPENALVVRSAQIVDKDLGTSPTTDRSIIEYRDTNFMAEYNPQDSQGVPKYFSYWDANTLVFAPTADAAYTIQLNYILKDPGLSATNTTTYLSLNFPNGLLYACLVEAYSFLKGPQDLLQLYEAKYNKAVEGFSVEQMGRRRRDEYIESSPRLQKQ